MLKKIECVTFDTPFIWNGEKMVCRDRHSPENMVAADGVDGPINLLWGTEVEVPDPKPQPVSFKRLDNAISRRKDEWFRELGEDGSRTVSLSFRGCELAGEAGEVCNEIKKLERANMGMVGGKTDTSDLADELGDVIICAALVAREAGVDLDKAVREKFNKTSDKHNFKTKL